MAKVTISFNNGDEKVFTDSAIDGKAIQGMFMVMPEQESSAYFYPIESIKQVVVEKEADRVTESGIVVVKPSLVTNIHDKKGGK